MTNEHVISDEVLNQARLSFLNNENWVAYNTINYFWETGDLHFFKTADEAHEFSDNNISEFDNYRVIHANSIDELLRRIPYGSNLKLSNMNEKNFDYLSNQLKYTGFGDDLNAQLKDKIQNQEGQFTLHYQKDFGKDQTVATLHFKKSDESEMYFFNRYSLILKNDQHPDPVKQTFYIGNMENNITLKEAYNLLSGRSVHKELSNKEGEKYNAWVQLDFKETDLRGNFKMKTYHENYGFDLKSILGKHSIKEMTNDSDLKRLLESLERGNRQSITLNMNGKEQKVFIEAVPQFKSLNFYELSGKRIRSDKLYETNSQEQSVKQGKKQNVSQQGDDHESGETDQKKSKRKRQKMT